MTNIIGNSTVHILILVIIAIIMLFALSSAFGQQALQATQGQQTTVSYNPAGYENTVETGTGATNQSGAVLQPLTPGQDLNAAGTTSTPQPGEPGATATNNFSLNLVNTLLHPKVLAILAVILIGTITVWLMGRPDFV